MTIEEKFEIVADLLSIIHEYRKNQVMEFGSHERKMNLKRVYQSIYGNILMDLACPDCVRNYLLLLEAWYEREHPKYLKSKPVAEPSILNETYSQPVENTKQQRKRKLNVPKEGSKNISSSSQKEVSAESE